MLRGTLEKCNTYAMIEMAGDSFKITHIANSFVDIRDTVSMTDAENVFEVSSPVAAAVASRHRVHCARHVNK